MLFPKRANFFIPALFLLLAVGGLVHGQSLDINSPAPVTTNELTGKILARDIGDARFTDHYYALVGNQGDLVVTIESKNLNGDVDIFSAVGLRPLMKFSIYAESSSSVSKAIFLRKREDLVLRVQARSPNDDEGSYVIRFSGSFEALPAPAVAENTTPVEESPSVSSAQKGRRVTSSGARIYEPEPAPAEVATATPEPTPEATPEPSLTETPSSSTEKADATKPKAPPRTPRRRGRRPTPTRPATETARKTEETQPTTEQPTDESSAPATTSSTSRRGSSRRTTPKTEPPATPAEDDVGPRLIIETSDGTLINRSMNTVRRVMVENGQVVVVGKDGGVHRVRLADVVRMTIAPQE
jgi:hypothetical protein